MIAARSFVFDDVGRLTGRNKAIVAGPDGHARCVDWDVHLALAEPSDLAAAVLRIEQLATCLFESLGAFDGAEFGAGALERLLDGVKDAMGRGAGHAVSALQGGAGEAQRAGEGSGLGAGAQGLVDHAAREHLVGVHDDRLLDGQSFALRHGLVSCARASLARHCRALAARLEPSGAAT